MLYWLIDSCICLTSSLYTGLYVTSPQESSHPEDNWGFVITYLNSISRSNTTASIKNITTTTAAADTATSAHTAESAKRIFAFRAISDEIGDSSSNAFARSNTATSRSRHLHYTVRGSSSGTKKDVQAQVDDDEGEEGCVTSRQKVHSIVELLKECCIDAGAFVPDEMKSEGEEDFVVHKTIQRYVSQSPPLATLIVPRMLRMLKLTFLPDLSRLTPNSLDEAKAMMPLFGPLIEGLKRRLWL